MARAKRVDWSEYAQVYDLMSQLNPAYQQLIKDFDRDLDRWNIGKGSLIIDYGGGTGNFSLLAARKHRTAQVLLVDSSAGMVRRAAEKSKAEALDNFQVRRADLISLQLPAESVDFAICVHALYSLSDPVAALMNIHRCLRSGGYFYICDIGRVIDTGEWARFLFKHLRGRYGIWSTLHKFWIGRAVARENRRIARAQREGHYWTHSPEVFASALATAGFKLERFSSCYRGYSDLAVCVKP
jgi:ubiquinone/menaquinone biosynthesis C-methylase UbiE